ASVSWLSTRIESGVPSAILSTASSSTLPTSFRIATSEANQRSQMASPLCKIHHGAYDANILGVSPDYTVEIRLDVLEERDGPMLQHGLQAMHERRLILPRVEAFHPKR